VAETPKPTTGGRHRNLKDTPWLCQSSDRTWTVSGAPLASACRAVRLPGQFGSVRPERACTASGKGQTVKPKLIPRFGEGIFLRWQQDLFRADPFARPLYEIWAMIISSGPQFVLFGRCRQCD
jgi:hypothetical protein